MARLRAILAILFFGTALDAQLVVKLSPQTVSEFDGYSQKVESQLKERWSGKANFLFIEDDPENRARVLAGNLFVRRMSPGEQPVSISGGLIHDWLGAVFIPNTTVERVVAVLEDFDHHKDFYHAVTDSHTLHRSDHDVTGSWHLEQKGLVPVVLDVEQEVRYSPLSPGKWKGQAYARKIIETDTGLFAHGRKFNLGEGHGYLWRLYSYWSLESINGGVLAECRTLSLSRDIPPALAWAVAPYAEKMPQDSLTATLKGTRKAASAPAH